MKYTITFWTVFVLTVIGNYGCGDNQPSQRTVSNVIQMDSMINSILSNHPNYATNDIVMEAAENEFIEKITPMLTNVNYIDDFDFEVFRIFKNPDWKGYIIHLNTPKKDNKINILADVVCMNADTTLAVSINNTKKYRVKKCKKLAILEQKLADHLSVKYDKKCYYPSKIYLENGIHGLNASLGILLCVEPVIISSL